MVLKVKLNGSGVPGDPYKVKLPTFQLLHANITQGFAYVLIPDDTHGLSEDDLNSETREETTEGAHYPNLSDAALAKAHDHLDNHYPQPKGTFRIEKI